MGYKMPNIVKEIYLPIPGDWKTLEEYKEEYGIDLREFIRLDSNAIYFNFGNAKVYLVLTEEYINQVGSNFSRVVPITYYTIKAKAGDAGAITQIGFSNEYNAESSLYGFGLYGSSVEHDIDHIDISPIIL